jgi:hypothetical protein
MDYTAMTTPELIEAITVALKRLPEDTQKALLHPYMDKIIAAMEKNQPN